MINNNKVFLGGACTSNWRKDLIPLLEIDYFNPIVEEWSEDLRLVVEKEKEFECDIHLYMIDSTMTGKYTFLEIGVSLMKNNIITIVQINPDNFTNKELDNMEAILNLVAENKGIGYFDDGLEYLATILNN